MKYLVTEDVEMLAPRVGGASWTKLDVSRPSSDVACAAPGRGRRWSRRERAATVREGSGRVEPLDTFPIAPS